MTVAREWSTADVVTLHWIDEDTPFVNLKDHNRQGQKNDLQIYGNASVKHIKLQTVSY